jgi:CBS domain-containing membrane protein
MKKPFMKSFLRRFPLPHSSIHMPRREMLFSVLGAFTAIFLLGMEVSLISDNTALTVLMLASMGASTCLLFAIPHSPLAQPWPVFGGHLISAVVGLACAHWISVPAIATASAVALAIAGMYYLRCIHPPSAGTAMIAVIGGPAIQSLGWSFVPVVALNAGTLLLLALAINNLIPGRRYPLRHTHHPHHKQFERTEHGQALKLTEADFGWALDQMDGVIAVTEEDLVDLYEFAVEHAQKRKGQPPS